MEQAAAVLPNGFWLNGVHHRQASLRALTGEDEVFLAETVRSLPPAAGVTALLTRCLGQLGPVRPVTAQSVQGLTVGDREALLLRLRQATLGEKVSCVLHCPACGEKLEMELSVRDLLLPAYADPKPWHDAEIRIGETGLRVRFRLPTGRDQEAAAESARSDFDGAVASLLKACIESVEVPSGEAPPDWAALASPLSDLMAELDPQAEILLNLVCPACGQAFSAPFDAAAQFLEEAAGRGRQLFREVHLLAFHYHWSEADILKLTSERRRLYLGLLAEALSQEAA